ncbi:HNH endonuclease [Nocardiopsis alba]|uniref:HNH endonuclease n=1 Tax=Nocardiopsis alba TaxID=53437 RepID=UPI00034926E6|nr:HNH endonuclease [Nocardiopsis alba]
MGPADITADAVLKAIAEYDALGREAFLDTYGFRLTSSYALAHDDRTYDPKAVFHAAHKYATGRLPYDSELPGGRADIEKRLRELGFEVRSTPSIPWAWDELILACDLLVEHGWKTLDTTRSEVIALSELLQRLPLHPREKRPVGFRSPNSVRLKTDNILNEHPDRDTKKTNGSARDAEIMWAFLDEPRRMRNAAENIRRGVRSGELAGLPAFEEEADEDISAPEGRLLIRKHYARERDRGLRKKKIDRTRAEGRPIACEACGFDFGATYGPRGKDYIEVHHVVPLHHIGESVTRLEDLALLCANCHRMIHVSRPWLTVDELRALLDR